MAILGKLYRKGESNKVERKVDNHTSGKVTSRDRRTVVCHSVHLGARNR